MKYTKRDGEIQHSIDCKGRKTIIWYWLWRNVYTNRSIRDSNINIVVFISLSLSYSYNASIILIYLIKNNWATG